VPVARYFILVGGMLATLLFIVGWYFPAPPAMFSNQTTVFDETIIRIRSEHKWPEKIVLDTSRPTMMPLAVEEPRVVQLVPLPSDEPGDQSSLEVKAQWKPDTRPPTVNHPTSRIKRRVARATRSTRAARGPIVRRLARAEPGGGCCQFGWWIDNGQTSTNAVPRRRAAAPWLN
jgi:hypothetical protein